MQARDEIHELRLVLVLAQLVDDLVGDRHDETGVVRQRRLRHEDQELPIAQPRHDFLRGLLARELAEVLFDVLDFERAGIERVLFDQVLQTGSSG